MFEQLQCQVASGNHRRDWKLQHRANTVDHTTV
jgi:hypothetical protein